MALAPRERLDTPPHGVRWKQKLSEVADDMAARPSYRHRIASMRTDALPERSFRVKLLAALIEIGHRQPGAVAHAAGIGLQFAEHEAQERGFANAVRPDQANAVAAHDTGREATHHHLRTESFRNRVEFKHHL